MFEMWPHDILLRTNMSTLVWPAMVAFRDASALDKDGAGIPAADLLQMIADIEDDPDTAAFLEDGVAVAVPSCKLYLSMWEAFPSEVSLINRLILVHGFKQVLIVWHNQYLCVTFILFTFT
jgi:hypothetical protein